MPRYVATSAGIGRLEPDETIRLLDLPGLSLEQAFRAGATVDSLGAAPARAELARADVVVGPPVRRPSKVWAVGFAYAEHSAEVGHERTDDDPLVFLKASTSIAGPDQPIRLPRLAPDRVDYEGEVAVVIGREGYDIPERAAWDHVLGFTAANDVSARDVQKQGIYNGGNPDPPKGKSFDTFTPLGPCLCTLDEYPDRNDLELRTTVDGVERQHARTSSLLFSIPRLVSFISRFGTLEPGDVLLTGTPAGVGHPQGRFLAPGSVVRVEVEGVGLLENPVIAE
jgi:2-keto-4-pentenoate hydratase/2-oxohepta-3-ene-1,7-dioic acid hydratase in catechol pathway